MATHTQVRKAKLDSLPCELLYEILFYLSIPDIHRLRQVSRGFYRLTHERPVWVNAYRQCTLLRPPGPLPFQSAADLERNLKKSILLVLNWTSPSPHPVLSRILPGDALKVVPEQMKLVMGRYLLVSSSGKLRCFDLDATDESFGQSIASYKIGMAKFDCDVVDTDTDAHECHTRLLCAITPIQFNPPVKVTLLHLNISNTTAQFDSRTQIEVPSSLGRFYDVIIKGDFLAIQMYSDHILFHIPTHQIYNLTRWDELTNIVLFRHISILIDTHLLAVSVTRDARYVMEVFPLPDTAGAQPSGLGATPALILNRSHIGMLPFRAVHPSPTFIPSPPGVCPTNFKDSHYHQYLPHHSVITLLVVHERIPTPEVGFLDLILPPSEASVTVSWSLSAEGGRDLCSLLDGSHSCIVHVVSISTFLSLALIVIEDDNCRSIIYKELPGTIAPVAWDGLRGRLCVCKYEQFRVEILDYV